MIAIVIPPFTRVYEPGYAKLKSRWWVYVLGVDAFAYWPAKFELWRAANPEALLVPTVCVASAVLILEVFGVGGRLDG
jgi:hypothetical protein